MIPGTFSFLLFLFSSPQQVMMHKLEGNWLVVEDYTPNKRSHWDKMYSFKSCGKEISREIKCQGYYGWVDQPGVVKNVLDKNYFNYGISRKKVENGFRKLFLHDEEFYFRLWPGKGKLEIINIANTNVIMIMKKSGYKFNPNSLINN